MQNWPSPSSFSARSISAIWLSTTSSLASSWSRCSSSERIASRRGRIEKLWVSMNSLASYSSASSIPGSTASAYSWICFHSCCAKVDFVQA